MMNSWDTIESNELDAQITAFKVECGKVIDVIQRAKVPSRTLDAMIGRLIVCHPKSAMLRATDDDFNTLPPFTSFVDAALLILLPTHVWSMQSISDSKSRSGWEAHAGAHATSRSQAFGLGATPALALCAACLADQLESGGHLARSKLDWWEVDAKAAEAAAESHARLVVRTLEPGWHGMHA